MPYFLAKMLADRLKNGFTIIRIGINDLKSCEHLRNFISATYVFRSGINYIKQNKIIVG